MTSSDQEGASVRFPPPFVYLGAVIVGGFVHQFLYPVSLGLPRSVRFAAATVVAAIGIGLMTAAAGLFKRTGQDPKPWLSTPEIISTGTYRFTRNPMYVGMALLQAATGLAWGNAWIITLVPVALVVVHVTAVRHEEVYLQERFGDAYLSYKNSVRRWV